MNSNGSVLCGGAQTLKIDDVLTDDHLGLVHLLGVFILSILITKGCQHPK
jgi:hypothetical protein